MQQCLYLFLIIRRHVSHHIAYPLRLAKAPEDITLKQVLAVVEPDLIDTKITLKGASGPQVAALWREVSKRFDKSLTGFTVAQLALTESGTDFEI